MSKDLIRYDLLVQDALKGVVRKVLGDATRDGLQGEHHFYISFRTDFPGVRLSQRLREKYPQEMTIVLQHQFWDLGVTEHAFEVGLSFSGVPERLLIPFDGLTGFYDPSVQFGLKFEVHEAGEEEAAPAPAIAPLPAAAGPVDLQPRPASKAAKKTQAKPADPEPPKAEPASAEEAPAEPAPDGPPSGAEVVSLDAFRKKN